MTIRLATENDLSEIIRLCQLSLGDAEGLRTEVYWRWKHEQNPFGKSPVLLAWEGNQLVGLRAFMRWRFSSHGKSFQGFRAVDTATHPDFQGKGIFSKLTMNLIDILQAEEPSLIFNTPNEKSKPGYLKMGWQVFGKTRLRVKVYPFHYLQKKIGVSMKTPLMGDWDVDFIHAVMMSWMKEQRSVITSYSYDYLQWRYMNMPVFSYGTKVIEDRDSQAALIYRIKKSHGVDELRITDVFYTGRFGGILIRRAIDELAESLKPDVVTILADSSGFIAASLPMGFFKADSRGLTITYRKLNDDGLVEMARQPDTWYFSAGTLELF